MKIKRYIAIIALLVTSVYAEGDNWQRLDKKQTVFLKEYVSVMQNKETNTYVKLVHPACRKYFEQHGVTLLTSLPFEQERKGYHVEESWISKYISDTNLESMVIMPIKPTHMMKIKFVKGETTTFYDFVSLNYIDHKYWINRAYPKPSALDLFLDEDE